MDQSIVNFLRNYKVDKSTYYSHVGLFYPKGRFQFSRDSFEELFEIYASCKGLKGLGEKADQYLPMLADIDLKLEMTDDTITNLYTEKDVELVIKTYQSVLLNVIENIRDEQLTCILLEKDPYIEKKNNKQYLKNGYHLHFPFLFIDKIDQQVHVLPRIKKQLQKLDLDDVDSSHVKNPWLMYGSSKSDDKKPYIVTKCYDQDYVEIDLETALKKYNIYNQEEEKIKYRKEIKYYLPRILSTRVYGRDEYIGNIKTNLPSFITNNIIRSEDDPNIRQFRKLTIKENLEKIRELMPLIGDWRSCDYNTWIEIGWALYNLTDGCKEGLESWLKFSKKCKDKYSEATCIFEWKKMKNEDKYTIGSFKFWAREDNENKYKLLKQKWVEARVDSTLEVQNGTHNDIAKILFDECEEEFKCSSLYGKTWYQFQKHCWKEMEEGVYLRQKISNELWDTYNKKFQEYYKKWIEARDKGDQAKYKVKSDQVVKIMKNLKSTPFKNNVMKESMEVFYDAKFNKKLMQIHG